MPIPEASADRKELLRARYVQIAGFDGGSQRSGSPEVCGLGLGLSPQLIADSFLEAPFCAWIDWRSMKVLVPVVAAVVSYLTLSIAIAPLRRAGRLGRDVHKPGHQEVPEMGGISLVGGFSAALLFALALMRFVQWGSGMDASLLMAVLATVLIAAIIGLVDDLLTLPQATKAFLPLLAALPLVAMRVGVTEIAVPVFGAIDVGWVYPLIFVPIGMTVATNASNMLAGLNGLEIGLGIVQMGSLAVIAAVLGEQTALVILLAGLGALFGAARYNWFPAKVFVGDVGTLTIGGVIAASAIVGNFEIAGVIVYIPHAVDFFLKALSGFPTRGWGGQLGQDGQLRCPGVRPVSLPQLVMKIAGGIGEAKLVLLLIGIEAIFGLAAVLLFVLK